MVRVAGHNAGTRTGAGGTGVDQGRLHPDHEGTPVLVMRPDIRPCLLRSGGAWWCFPLELKESGDSMTTLWRRKTEGRETN